jgi:hypothetical protein
LCTPAKEKRRVSGPGSGQSWFWGIFCAEHSLLALVNGRESIRVVANVVSEQINLEREQPDPRERGSGSLRIKKSHRPT